MREFHCVSLEKYEKNPSRLLVHAFTFDGYSDESAGKVPHPRVSRASRIFIASIGRVTFAIANPASAMDAGGKWPMEMN